MFKKDRKSYKTGVGWFAGDCRAVKMFSETIELDK